MKDIYYTSPSLASHLLGYIKKKRVAKIADFCVGHGELLKAAIKKYKNAICYGTDIDADAISKCEQDNPQWILSVCDFLNQDSRSGCDILNENKFDLILLNPPFSCRGSKIHKLMFHNEIFHTSTAMKFLVESLQYLGDNGEIFAIMPISVIYSQKDKKIRDILFSNYNLHIIEEKEHQPFISCNPNIVIISISNKSKKNNTIEERAQTSILPFDSYIVSSIFRGNLSVHEMSQYMSAKGSYYVHSTNLKNNTIVNKEIRVVRDQSKIQGPALLMHRVGKPDVKKLCVINTGESYILSDCVIAIVCTSEETAKVLFDAILSHEEMFLSAYKGTGAKYITLKRLKQILGIT